MGKGQPSAARHGFERARPAAEGWSHPGVGTDILHILYGGLGGQVSVASELARRFEQRGLRSAACLYARPGEHLDRRTVQSLGFRAVQHVEKTRRFDRSGARRIGHVVEQLRPRAVLWHSHYAPLELATAVRRGTTRALIMVEHQPLHLRTGPDNLRSSLGACVADRVVFLSPDYRDAYPLQRLPLGSVRNGTVIPNGVDLQRFSPAARSEDPGVIRLGMMARMIPTRDFAGLIRAVRVLVDDGRPVKLALAGDGTDRAGLIHLVKELGLQKEVVFLGRLDESALIRYLEGLDIYVHATHGETLSTSLLQAYAMGLPVVASSVPGVSNLIEDGQDGVLVPPEDPETLAEVLGRLGDPCQAGTRRELGRRARARAERDFGAGLMTDRYLRLLAEVDPTGPWAGAA